MWPLYHELFRVTRPAGPQYPTVGVFTFFSGVAGALIVGLVFSVCFLCRTVRSFGVSFVQFSGFSGIGSL